MSRFSSPHTRRLRRQHTARARLSLALSLAAVGALGGALRLVTVLRHADAGEGAAPLSAILQPAAPPLPAAHTPEPPAVPLPPPPEPPLPPLPSLPAIATMPPPLLPELPIPPAAAVEEPDLLAELMPEEAPPSPRPSRATPPARPRPAVATAPAAPAAAAAAEPYTPPAYRSAPKPPYPAAMRSMRAEGTVHLRIVIDSLGAPQSVEVIGSSGYAEFDTTARRWVLAHWRFTPAYCGSRPVPATITTRLHFVLS